MFLSWLFAISRFFWAFFLDSFFSPSWTTIGSPSNSPGSTFALMIGSSSVSSCYVVSATLSRDASLSLLAATRLCSLSSSSTLLLAIVLISFISSYILRVVPVSSRSALNISWTLESAYSLCLTLISPVRQASRCSVIMSSILTG